MGRLSVKINEGKLESPTSSVVARWDTLVLHTRVPYTQRIHYNSVIEAVAVPTRGNVFALDASG